MKNLVVPCNIGISEAERAQRQNVILDLEISCDLNLAGISDDIQQTLDYYKIMEELTTLIANTQFKLLESLAEAVTANILKNPKAISVTVVVKKEKFAQSPILGIEISRDRHG